MNDWPAGSGKKILRMTIEPGTMHTIAFWILRSDELKLCSTRSSLRTSTEALARVGVESAGVGSVVSEEGIRLPDARHVDGIELRRNGHGVRSISFLGIDVKCYVAGMYSREPLTREEDVYASAGGGDGGTTAAGAAGVCAAAAGGGSEAAERCAAAAWAAVGAPRCLRRRHCHWSDRTPLRRQQCRRRRRRQC